MWSRTFRTSPRTPPGGGTVASMAPTAFEPTADRVVERRRAVALARHYREAEGLSIGQIADRVGRSPATIKAYFYDPTDANKGLSRERVAPADGGRAALIDAGLAIAREQGHGVDHRDARPANDPSVREIGEKQVPPYLRPKTRIASGTYICLLRGGRRSMAPLRARRADR